MGSNEPTKKYRVFFSSYRNVYGHVDVEAESEDDAADLAHDYDIEWDDEGDMDGDVEIDEIRSIDANGVLKPYRSSQTPLRGNPATGYQGTELMLR